MKIPKYFLTIVAILFSTLLSSFVLAKNVNEYFAFKQNQKLGRGVNILSADPVWKDFSTARMKEIHFKKIKEAGFDNVRIAIHPFDFSMHDAAYTIDPKFFTTLDWAVKQAQKNKLMAIIDLHEHHAMQADPAGTKPMLIAMWRQIAEHYKTYPNSVLFEIANEPNMKPGMWNDIQSAVYKVLRESNPKRTLVIGTINGNQIEYLKDLTLPQNDRNIIVAIHYYEPIQFTHQGAPWSEKTRTLKGITWANTAAQEKAVIDDFDKAQAWSVLNKRPLTLGEFGAYEKADLPSRVRWTSFVSVQSTPHFHSSR